jgi:penicillin G amidase
MNRRLVKGIALAVLVVVFVPIAVMHGVLRASLPELDGDLRTRDVLAPVSIERDALGIPTITAANRSDLAYATGFAHGQDRFFQMDLSRRLAAGELSELFGDAALEQDKKARLFRFRHVARQVLQQAPPKQRALLASYARGVNAGIQSLRSRPWEYWLLGVKPVAWRDEDSVLVVLAMWWDLQYHDFAVEKARFAVNARLTGADCEDNWKCTLRFLYPDRTRWDAPNVADENALRAAVADADTLQKVPAAEDLNVRKAAVAAPAHEDSDRFPPRSAIGSNNWAIAGRFTAHGGALVASDMHLNLRIPAVWYRARLRITGAAPNQPRTGGAADAPLDLNGVTLPGAPLLIAGSNGSVAWGFTNSYGDWSDLHPAACAADGQSPPSTAAGPVPVVVFPETIHVKGGQDVVLPVRTSPIGVLIEQDHETCWFAQWLAQEPSATNLNMIAFERAQSVAEMLAIAPTVGIPHQNLVVGDKAGHIAWTVAGRVPLSAASDRLQGKPVWRTADTQPRLVDPALGRIWSANARPIQDTVAEAAIGGNESTLGAGYDLGARASQIRDGLLTLKSGTTPAQMLEIQLDDRALFLEHWQKLLVTLLDENALAGKPQRAEFKRLIENWEPRASADSVGYRLMRAFHAHATDTVWQMILSALQVEERDVPPPAQFEEPLWTLVTEQPLHMLAAEYPSWRDFLLAQVDVTINDLQTQCPSLLRCQWGDRKPVTVRHPLSGALSFASRMLNMPTYELPGDHDMPRVQEGSFGASERFAVSPGHENEGYLHIAGGQSGHPLSPYYRAGFAEWAEGKPLPFLPGKAEHTFALTPP